MNVLEKFTKKKKKEPLKENLKIQKDFEINFSTLDKYDRGDLLDFLKKYEKYSVNLKSALQDQITNTEEVIKEKNTINDQMAAQSESIDFLREETQKAMAGYQQMMDQKECNKYMDSFAEKILRDVMKVDSGQNLQNECYDM